MSKSLPFVFLLLVGFLLTACAGNQPWISRFIPKEQVTVEVTRVVRESQVVTVEVTRVAPMEIVVTPTTQPVASYEISPGPDLKVARYSHTATRLKDNRVIVVGGSGASDQALADVEIYDPSSGKIKLAAPLHTARHDHSATLLEDGRVLVIAGFTVPGNWLRNAEIYDPAKNSWTVTQPLYEHGVFHTATRMKDGRVLVVGGAIGNGVATDRAEIFDPQTNQWSEAARLESGRHLHTALLLDDGRVLVVGGSTAAGTPAAGGDALVYRPDKNQWTSVGPVVHARLRPEAVRLSDGHILVTGGFPVGNMDANSPLAATEIFDPVKNIWMVAWDLNVGRYSHQLIPLPGGQVLAVGGARDWETNWSESSFVREVELFDPAKSGWQTVGHLSQSTMDGAASLLSDGSVWITGGRTRIDVYANTWLIKKTYR